MPGIPLVSRQANYSRNLDEMCRQEPRIRLTREEQAEAEESLSAYCKPVELYNILQRRAIRNPAFLHRCMDYMLQENHKKRVQVSVSISRDIDHGLQTESLFPLYVFLVKPVAIPNGEEAQWSSFYCFRVGKSIAFDGAETVNSAQAKFVLPEINKLSAVVKSGDLAMLLVRCADITNSQGTDPTKDHMFSPSSNIEGGCLLGKIPIDFLDLAREKSLNLSLGERAETMSTVSMQSCPMKLTCLDEGKYVSFGFPDNSEAVQVPVIIFAEELGTKDISPDDVALYNNVPPNLLSDVMSLRTGTVMFNYKYYNNLLQRTEVTEGFACPFCLVKCANFKGLKCHLTSSHDLLNYEFWANENYQVVVVSMKPDISEIVAKYEDPKLTYSYCHKRARRRNRATRTQTANHVHPLVLDSNMPAPPSELRGISDRVEQDPYIPNPTDVSSANRRSSAEPASALSGPGSNLVTPALLRLGRTRKSSAERSGPRNPSLLLKRQFYHSRSFQPMSLEEVLADQDSEDEVDDHVADLEDRRMLNDFVDVAETEKQLMHYWNSFVRKQRVLADGHIPWACEAFSKLHGKDLLQNPRMRRCWDMLLIKFWNTGLVDGTTINNCTHIIKEHKSQNGGPN